MPKCAKETSPGWGWMGLEEATQKQQSQSPHLTAVSSVWLPIAYPMVWLWCQVALCRAYLCTKKHPQKMMEHWATMGKESSQCGSGQQRKTRATFWTPKADECWYSAELHAPFSVGHMLREWGVGGGGRDVRCVQIPKPGDLCLAWETEAQTAHAWKQFSQDNLPTLLQGHRGHSEYICTRVRRQCTQVQWAHSMLSQIISLHLACDSTWVQGPRGACVHEQRRLQMIFPSRWMPRTFPPLILPPFLLGIMLWGAYDQETRNSEPRR